MAIAAAPQDNLPDPSMKWGRWVSTSITDLDRRIGILEATISNLNKTILTLTK